MFFHFPYACGFGSLNVALEAAYATYQCKLVTFKFASLSSIYIVGFRQFRSQIVLPPNDVVINRLVVGESDRDLVSYKMFLFFIVLISLPPSLSLSLSLSRFLFLSYFCNSMNWNSSNSKWQKISFV
jgi:hypothetical protein